MITYTIAESQLVRLFHDCPEHAWHLPHADDVTVVASVDDSILLSDGRVIRITGDFAEASYPLATVQA